MNTIVKTAINIASMELVNHCCYSRGHHGQRAPCAVLVTIAVRAIYSSHLSLSSELKSSFYQDHTVDHAQKGVVIKTPKK